jgi:hypothetical protein
MRTLLAVGWVGALAVAALVYPVVAILASGATDAYVIAAKSPELVNINKQSFDAREPKESDESFRRRVIEIYGNPIDYTTPVLFVPKEKFIHPEQIPGLVLLPVDKQKGENPLQVKSLYFFAKYIVSASSVSFVVLIGLWLILRKRVKKDPTPAAP